MKLQLFRSSQDILIFYEIKSFQTQNALQPENILQKSAPQKYFLNRILKAIFSI